MMHASIRVEDLRKKLKELKLELNKTIELGMLHECEVENSKKRKKTKKAGTIKRVRSFEYTLRKTCPE